MNDTDLVISLRDHFDARHDEARLACALAAATTQRTFDKIESEFHARLVAMEASFTKELAAEREITVAMFLASEKAIGKAEMSAEKRFEAVNEFRAQLADLIRTFIPRSESLAMFASVSEKLEMLAKQSDSRLAGLLTELGLLRDSRSKGEGRAKGMEASWGILLGAMALIATLLSIFGMIRK